MTESELRMEQAEMPVLVSPPDHAPGHLLRIARGFSSLFWGQLLLAGVYALEPLLTIPMRWMFALLVLGYLPLVGGLWMLRAAGLFTPKWGRRIGRVAMLVLISIYLSPFWAWWRLSPLHLYFAVNVAAQILSMVVLLVETNRLAGEFARGLNDKLLLRESQAGSLMVVWLTACSVMAVGWLFYRAGLLDAGVSAVLAQLSELPQETRYLCMLPFAMTAYVMWRAKETAFRHAAGAAD